MSVSFDPSIQCIHILGPPGAGTTTLGKELAEKIGGVHFDTDDFYWFTTDPLPYKRKRNTEHRRKLLTEALDSTPKWVLSGALCGWGDVFIPRFELVIYLWAPVEVRLERILQRETQRYGPERLAKGGDLNVVFEKFLDWAAQYEENHENTRSRTKEEEWLLKLPCQVLRLP